jgi:hypothetical protein
LFVLFLLSFVARVLWITPLASSKYSYWTTKEIFLKINYFHGLFIPFVIYLFLTISIFWMKEKTQHNRKLKRRTPSKTGGEFRCSRR